MKYFESSGKFVYEINNNRILIEKSEFREAAFSDNEEDETRGDKVEPGDKVSSYYIYRFEHHVILY